jgi:tRNA G26 N,N-dimethylase Trm1
MKEVPLIEHAFANDLEQEAVNMMKENLKINDLTTKVEG